MNFYLMYANSEYFEIADANLQEEAAANSKFDETLLSDYFKIYAHVRDFYCLAMIVLFNLFSS